MTPLDWVRNLLLINVRKRALAVRRCALRFDKCNKPSAITLMSINGRCTSMCRETAPSLRENRYCHLKGNKPVFYIHVRARDMIATLQEVVGKPERPHLVEVSIGYMAQR